MSEEAVIAVPVEKGEAKDEVKYPRAISKIVYVRRKKMFGGLPEYVNGSWTFDNTEEDKLKIGSSFKGGSVLAGLTLLEEERFLGKILNLDPQKDSWEKATTMYWRNISKDVPPGEGLKLEIGLKYKTEVDYKADLYSKDLTEFGGAVINPKGEPINIHDYILWRYCLEYNCVANNPEKVNDSPKILFYLYSKDAEITANKNRMDGKKKALNLLYSRLGERDWVNYTLRVLIATDKNSARKFTVKDLDVMTNDEKDTVIDAYATEAPLRFLEVANDKNLEMKSFVELCIATGKLQRIPNTDSIVMDSTPLGNTTNEAIAFLLNPKNANTFNTLKAQIKHIP